ncbi:unnamed protein product, partial [Ixodes hexagonus]
IGSSRPYSAVLAVWLGIPPLIFGAVTLAMSVVSVPVKLGIGALADRTQKLNLLITLIAVTEGSSHLYLSFIQPVRLPHVEFFSLTTLYSSPRKGRDVCFPVKSDYPTDLPCLLLCGCKVSLETSPLINSTLNSSFLLDSQGHCMSSRRLDEGQRDYFCEISSDYLCVLRCPDRGQLFSHGYYWHYVAARVISGMTSSALIPLTDAMTYAIAGSEGGRGEGDNALAVFYSHYRLWGAIGWGSMGLVAGVTNQMAGESALTTDYSCGLYINASLTALDVMVLLYVVVPRRARPCMAVRNSEEAAFLPPRTILLLLSLFVVGFLSSVFTLYGFVHLQDLGASRTTMGLTMAAHCLVGEFASLTAADWFFAKLSQGSIFNLTLGATIARCLAYAMARKTWHVMPAEVTYGFCYGLLCASYTSAGAASEAALRSQTLMQCLLGAVLEEFGVGIGSFVGGLCFTNGGGRMTYIYFLHFCIVYTLLHIPLERYLSAKEKK